MKNMLYLDIMFLGVGKMFDDLKIKGKTNGYNRRRGFLKEPVIESTTSAQAVVLLIKSKGKIREET